MKAIINMSHNSASTYRSLNGNTFEIKEVLSTLICLLIPNGFGGFKSVDFSFKEVLIVDIEKNLQLEYDSFNWGSSNCFRNLEKYIEVNSLSVIAPQYNCPA